VSLVLAWLIDNRDQQFRQLGSRKKDHLLTFILIVLLGFFCGLRTWGNDTGTYLEIFNDLTPTWDTIGPDWNPSFSEGIAFAYVNVFLKSIGLSDQDYLMFYAFATALLYVAFVRRFSKSMLFGVFLLFTADMYTFSLAAIKQCVAMGLCLWGMGFAIERKWFHYGVFTAVACLFQPYAVVYFLLPLLFFKPWTQMTMIYVVAFAIAGVFLESLLGTVLDVTVLMGAKYDANEFTGDGVNIFRVMVCLVPMLLALLYGKRLFASTGRAEDLLFNMAMLNGLIMFVGIFGTANYFARLANYFLPAQIIVLPNILLKAPQKNRKWLIPLCIIGYLGYFYYENAIIRPFDLTYHHMSLWEYLVFLF
jgi:hypothetical protein